MSEKQIDIRPYEPGDIDSVYNTLLASAEHDEVDEQSTSEVLPSKDSLQEELEQLAANADTDVLVAVDRASGETIGYGTIKWWTEDDGTILYLHKGSIHPEHREHGAGTALLGAFQGRIQDIAASHPADAPKYYGSNASDTEKGADELLEKDGYQKVWSQVEMEFTDLDELEERGLPEGFELRSVSTEEEKRAIYDAFKANYKGHFGATKTSEEDYRELLEDTPDMNLWKVLWQDDKLAAFVLSRDDDQAEVVEVGTVPEFRGKGLAKYLMLESMRELKGRGASSIRLHTDADNGMGARSLYEGLGFKPLKEHKKYRKKLV